MAAPDIPPSRPVLEALPTILRDTTFIAAYGQWNFNECSGIKRGGIKCGRRFKEARIVNARSLYDKFSFLSQLPATEEFFGQFASFLVDSHCQDHIRGAEASFSTWKLTLASQELSPTLPSSSTGEVAPDISCLSLNDADPPLSSPASNRATCIQDPIKRKPVPARVPSIHRLSRASFQEGDDTYASFNAKESCAASDPGSEHDSAVAIESVSEKLSTLKVTPSEIVDPNEQDETSEAVLDERIFQLGNLTIQRKGSVRDPTPFMKEMYRHLTKRQQAEGIVYVLAHKTQPGLYKIGFSTLSAEKRLGQANNCYAVNTEIIHKTKGHFFAAEKAEQLAHKALRHYNRILTDCEQCQGRQTHKEWFRVSRETVIQTVEAMERFVKLPGYELHEGGDWKLSKAVHEQMSKVTAESIVQSMTSVEEVSVELQTSDGPTLKVNSTTRITRSIAVAEIQSKAAEVSHAVAEIEPSIEREENEVSGGPKKVREFARIAGRAIGSGWKETKRKTNERLQGFRSRESTPEADGYSPSVGSGGRERSSSGADNVRHAIMGMLWATVPEDIKVEQSQERQQDRAIRLIAALKKSAGAWFSDIGNEFKRGYSEASTLPETKVAS
ncbi:hypothetical protein ACHAQA_002762 [Verticillium albo-atrum]